MEYLSQFENEEFALGRTVELLHSGGVIVVPTETVYGLICLESEANAQDRIVKIKNRPSEKYFQILLDSISMGQELGIVFDSVARTLAAKFWPGPLTMVLPCQDGGTAGVRLPDHAFMKKLLARVGVALVATSANLSGEAPVVDVSKLDGYFLDEQPDLVIDGGQLGTGVSSTVLQVLEKDGVRILREGDITEYEVIKALNL